VATFVVDTSAILCVLFQEEGANQVVEILNAPRGPGQRDRTLVFVPFVALMEMEYWLLQRLSPGEVERTMLMVGSWPVVITESNEEWRHRAARIKAENPLSLADAWIASLAMLEGADLVHKDPEFDRLSEMKSLRLPYSEVSPQRVPATALLPRPPIPYLSDDQLVAVFG